MSDNLSTYALVAGLGAIAGMRSLSAPALLSRHLSRRKQKSKGKVAQLFASRGASTALGLLAIGELMADKAPGAPDRTELPSLGGRAFFGALCGTVVAGERGSSQIGAALLGASSALGSTFVAHKIRTRAGERFQVPQVVLGLVEDSLVYSAGSRLVSALPETATI